MSCSLSLFVFTSLATNDSVHLSIPASSNLFSLKCNLGHEPYSYVEPRLPCPSMTVLPPHLLFRNITLFLYISVDFQVINEVWVSSRMTVATWAQSKVPWNIRDLRRDRDQASRLIFSCRCPMVHFATLPQPGQA